MPERGGLLVLDEPEAGLSFLSQLTLVHQLANWCTRTPRYWSRPTPRLSRAAPGARLLRFDEAGCREVSWEALESVQLYRRFPAGPSAFLDAL